MERHPDNFPIDPHKSATLSSRQTALLATESGRKIYDEIRDRLTRHGFDWVSAK